MIYVLDCTLRDGGYVNGFNFGSSSIRHILMNLSKAQIEIVECGFLRSGADDENKSLYANVQSIKKYLPKTSQTMFVAMIAYGDISANEIEPCDGSSVTGIRLTFHEKNIDNALAFAVELMKKGYQVFVQPVGITTYTDKALIDLIERVNHLNPFAFYLVDTLGVLYKKDLMRMFYLVENNLSPEIKIGFHSHNNLQLSFSNAQELMQTNTKRDIIIDSSVFGMGRGAGNLCTELLVHYINENLENKYELLPVLEVMDEHIMPIFSAAPWGYAAPYYIASVNNCHPNYASFLTNKQTLCVRDIHAILKTIPIDKRELYHPKLITELYLEYQKHTVDDVNVLATIRNLCAGRDTLILAPGMTLKTHRQEVSEFIDKYDPVVFSVNHIPQLFRFDMVFISNTKRFNGIENAAEKLGEKLICTSNISDESIANRVNYTDYLIDDKTIVDNSGLMLINVLKKAGITKIHLAGYDGFNLSSENYFDEKLNLAVQNKSRAEMNCAIKQFFEKIRRYMQVIFVTPTIYDNGVEYDSISNI